MKNNKTYALIFLLNLTKPEPVHTRDSQPVAWQHTHGEAAHDSLCALLLQVVDEADRLLRQTYHGWLAALQAALAPPAGRAARRVLRILVSATLTRDPSKLSRFDLHSPRCAHPACAGPLCRLPQPAAPTPFTLNASSSARSDGISTPVSTPVRMHAPICCMPGCTHGAAAFLRVRRRCRYIEIGHPAAAAGGAGGPARGLQEFQIVTAAHSKPQALVALLCELRAAAADDGGGGVRAIVFASGVDVTRRLTTLLRGCCDHLRLRVHELSSRVPPKEQAAVLAGLGDASNWCASEQLPLLLMLLVVAHPLTPPLLLTRPRGRSGSARDAWTAVAACVAAA